MTAKSVLVRPQGLRPRARAPPCYATSQGAGYPSYATGDGGLGRSP